MICRNDLEKLHRKQSQTQNPTIVSDFQSGADIFLSSLFPYVFV